MNKKLLLDFLLFPESLYKKYDSHKWPVIIGNLLIGLIYLDYLVITKFSDIELSSTSHFSLFYHILYSFLIVYFIGFFNVIIFSYPMYDFFKMNKKHITSNCDSTLTILAKIYITAHLLVIPFQLLLLSILKFLGLFNNPELIFTLRILLGFILPIWFCSIITRGIRITFNFDCKMLRKIFIPIFTWYILLSLAMVFIIENWVIRIFNYF
jgi:hypothetical protein